MDYYLQMIQFDRQIILRVIEILRHLNITYRLLILHNLSHVLQFV